MEIKKRWGFTCKAVAVISLASLLGFLVFISSESGLPKISRFLMCDNPLERMEAVVVLGGGRGNRIRAGAKLFKQGLADFLVFSGLEIYPGVYSHNLMSDYAISLGVPKDKILFKPLVEEISTWGEGIDNLSLLRENNIKSFILVTSYHHTKRAKAVYDKLILNEFDEMKFLVHAAPDPDAPLAGWWRTRRGKKTIFLEYQKLIYYYFKNKF